MSDDEDDPYGFKVRVQRGNGTDDRDTFEARVSASAIDQLDQRVEDIREKIEGWAGEFRRIQPDEEPDLPDDQATLEEGADA